MEWLHGQHLDLNLKIKDISICRQLLKLLKKQEEGIMDFVFFKFRYVPLLIQINIMMPEAFAEKNQSCGSLLETAEMLKINVISCSPLLSGSLINVPLPADRLLCRHNGAKHLQFIRSIPSSALVSTLIGQKLNRHVKKNAEVLSVPPLSESQWLEMIVPSETAPPI